MSKIGIDAISYYVPSIYLSIEELSKNRELDYEKLSKGLGLEKMAVACKNYAALKLCAFPTINKNISITNI